MDETRDQTKNFPVVSNWEPNKTQIEDEIYAYLSKDIENRCLLLTTEN